MIGLSVVKVFLKHNINILSVLTLYWSEKRFSHHSKLRLCTIKEFFLIESIKICDNLKNENRYLCLQVNCLDKIKCHKNHFLYLKLILLQNWKIFRNRGLHFIHLNINSLLPTIDELREIVKISNPTDYRNEIR